MADLINIAAAVGSYNSVSTELTSEAITVQLVDTLAITKTANKTIWAGTDELVYTITITNTDTTFSYDLPTISDTLDITLIDLVTDSVMLDGAPIAYTYDNGTGLLTIELTAGVAAGASAVVTFQVQKI